MSAIKLFDEGAARYGDRTCLRFSEHTLSYREVAEQSHRVASGLTALGLAPGSKAAVVSLNDPWAFIAILGALRAGLVWLPINPRNAEAENVQLLAQFGCDVLIHQARFAAMLPALRSTAPRLRHFICIDQDGDAQPVLRDWAARHEARFAPLPDDPDRLVAISATGGTTGRPKGVMMSNRNFVAFSRGHEAALADDDPAVYLGAAPMTHVAGRICFPVMHAGGTVVVLPQPEPQAILAAIQRHRVTRLFLPPTAIYALLDHPDLGEFDLSSLRYLMYGAAPMSVAKLKQALRVFGPVMMQGYGQTEAPMQIAHLSREDHFKGGVLGGEIADDTRLTSCGKPTEAVQVRIMDDEGRILPPGETGEIVVRGDIVMVGYWRDDAATAEASRFGWHHTGDIGRFDDEGYLHIVDRKKDMIISGGFNIYSSEVEQVILSLPGVRDCAVIGVPDEKWGEAVKAVVQPIEGATLDPAAIIAACRSRLGGVKTPKSVEVWPELPKNPAGKVLKRAIREGFWAGHARKV